MAQAKKRTDYVFEEEMVVTKEGRIRSYRDAFSGSGYSSISFNPDRHRKFKLKVKLHKGFFDPAEITMFVEEEEDMARGVSINMTELEAPVMINERKVKMTKGGKFVPSTKAGVRKLLGVIKQYFEEDPSGKKIPVKKKNESKNESKKDSEIKEVKAEDIKEVKEEKNV